jgi:hypothetical protein
MRVRCISTDVMKLPKEYLQPIGIYSDYTEQYNQLFLTVGKIYTVYAISFFNGGVYFYVCDDCLPSNEPGSFPIHKGAPLFEVIDGTLSKYWHFNYITWQYEGDRHKSDAIIEPSDWVSDASLYERLVDGDLKAQEAWWQLKRLMDEEAEGC